jgi:hypothetical protein
MTPREQTDCLLQQWLQMTRAESQAIQAAAWPKLREIQSRKAALRQPLGLAFRQWKSGQPSGPGPAAQNPFRAPLARLIALEERNAQFLAGRRENARRQQLRLERAAHNLRNLRRSYGPPPPVAWNSYS